MCLLFIIISCDNEDETLPITEQKCEIQSEYFFTGIVNDTLKCFNKGINNYQWYSGGSYQGDTINGRFMIGMDTYPVSVDDEHIFIYTPIVNTSDPEKISALFPKGMLTNDEKSNFILHYNIVTNVEEGLYPEMEYLKAKFYEESSSIEVIDFFKVSYNPIYISSSVFYIKLLINCNLYDSSGNLKYSLVSGELGGLIYSSDTSLK